MTNGSDKLATRASAIVVLLFAGIVAVGAAIGRFRISGVVPMGASLLAAISLVAVVPMLVRLAGELSALRKGGQLGHRRIALAIWAALSLSLAGTLMAAWLVATPGAVADETNDAAVYAAAGLFSAALLTLFLISVLEAISRSRSRM